MHFSFSPLHTNLLNDLFYLILLFSGLLFFLFINPTDPKNDITITPSNPLVDGAESPVLGSPANGTSSSKISIKPPLFLGSLLNGTSSSSITASGTSSSTISVGGVNDSEPDVLVELLVL